MRGVGEGIAFAGLCMSLAWMTAEGKEVSVWLWCLVAVWAMSSDWGNK